MVYFTKNSTKKRQKITFCNALHAKTVKAAGLKFAVNIPITIMELVKKTADQYLLWDQRYGGFKKLTFRRRHSNLFAPTVAYQRKIPLVRKSYSLYLWRTLQKGVDDVDEDDDE